jgi:hypothetical protein
VAEEPERAEEYELTDADWGRIHALAWRNQEKVSVKDAQGRTVEKHFREALETDPTAAIMHYAGIRGLKSKKLKIVKLRPPPPDDIPEEFWDDINPFPPSCC